MKNFLKFWAELQKRLTPPRLFSWQTLILMSVLCWGIALGYKIVFLERAYESANAGDLFAGFAWVFLIIALDWWASEKPWYIGGFHLGSLLTGALICLFVFAVFAENYRSEFPSFIFLMWPVISALIALLHKLQKSGSDLSVAQVFILIFTSLLISCWWEFNFLLQDWLQEYPSLLADNFERSAFVIKLDFSPREKARGIQILNSLEEFLKSHVEEKPWPEVKAWLLEIDRQLKPRPAKGQPWPEVHQWLVELDEQGDAYEDRIMVNLGNLEEDKWWYIKTEIELDGWQYEFKLQAIWRGPTSNAEEYEMTKVCQIGQTYQQEAPRASALPELELAETGFVECAPVDSSLDRRTESSD